MDDALKAADVFKALGDEHRLKMLEFIVRNDPNDCLTPNGICGCDLQAISGLAQATVSHHLKILSDAGLITGTKRGRWVYYQLSETGLAVARSALEGFSAPITSDLLSTKRTQKTRGRTLPTLRLAVNR